MLTDAVKDALRERLKRERTGPVQAHRVVERVMDIARRAASRPVPVLNGRSLDEIVGYDELMSGDSTLMVIDTSAVLSIVLQEPEAERMAMAIASNPVRRMSAANW